ncbi:MAG TPA: hypothetical protein VIY47_09955 [Ignavibacteriaceae bacterium]
MDLLSARGNILLPDIFMSEDPRCLKSIDTRESESIQCSPEFKALPEYYLFQLAFALCYASDKWGKDQWVSGSKIHGIRVLYRLETILDLYDGEIHTTISSIPEEKWGMPFLLETQENLLKWRQQPTHVRIPHEDFFCGWIRTYIRCRDQMLKARKLEALNIEPSAEEKHPWIHENKTPVFRI